MPSTLENIGATGRRARLTFGLVIGVAGVAASAGLAYVGAPPGYRLLVAPVFYLGGLGVFQARAKT